MESYPMITKSYSILASPFWSSYLYLEDATLHALSDAASSSVPLFLVLKNMKCLAYPQGSFQLL